MLKPLTTTECKDSPSLLQMMSETHRYLCGVRQKSLHSPLMAGSGNSKTKAFYSLLLFTEDRKVERLKKKEDISSHLCPLYTVSGLRISPYAPSRWLYSLSQQISSACLKPEATLTMRKENMTAVLCKS